MKRVLILIVFSIILSSVLLSASWPIGKFQTCSMLNMSLTDCDQAWCSIIDCSYDSNRTACICIDGVNVNLTNVYNKTEIESRLNEIKANMTNISYNQTINYSMPDCYTKAEILNLTIALRDSILNSQENRTEEIVLKYVGKYDDEDYQKTEPLSPWVFIAIAAIVAAVVVFLSWQSMQAKKFAADRPKVKPFQREFIDPKKFQGDENIKLEVEK